MKKLTVIQQNILLGLQFMQEHIQKQHIIRPILPWKLSKLEWQPDNISIPSFEDLEKQAFQLILNQEVFSKIERVSPDAANCVIRIYRKENYEGFGIMTRVHLCGIIFKPLISTVPFIESNGNPLFFSECKVIFCLHNETEYIPVDFFDVYVNVE